jgi:hypothetical protein
MPRIANTAKSGAVDQPEQAGRHVAARLPRARPPEIRQQLTRNNADPTGP